MARRVTSRSCADGDPTPSICAVPPISTICWTTKAKAPVLPVVIGDAFGDLAPGRSMHFVSPRAEMTLFGRCETRQAINERALAGAVGAEQNEDALPCCRKLVSSTTRTAASSTRVSSAKSRTISRCASASQRPRPRMVCREQRTRPTFHDDLRTKSCRPRESEIIIRARICNVRPGPLPNLGNVPSERGGRMYRINGGRVEFTLRVWFARFARSAHFRRNELFVI